jgi:hypothetical protein
MLKKDDPRSQMVYYQVSRRPYFACKHSHQICIDGHWHLYFTIDSWHGHEDGYEGLGPGMCMGRMYYHILLTANIVTQMLAWNLETHVLQGYEFLMQNCKSLPRITR